MKNNLKTLIGKLNGTCREALEHAANVCLSHGHFEVDVEHFLFALLENQSSDISILCARYNVSHTGLKNDIDSVLRQLKDGNTRTPVFSRHLISMLEHAWLIASLDPTYAHIRSSHLLLALLTEPGLQQMAIRCSGLFEKINIEELKHQLSKITSSSIEATTVAIKSIESENEITLKESAVTIKTQALNRFTTNLTQRARDGLLDPVIGRENEIRQVIDILMRRRQNNPILTGEAGVGKTAVVEGLALRLAADEVPQTLQGVELHVLDMGLLQAGASVKGEFENRLKNVIDEVKKSPHPIILFIDEAHTMIGAGGQAGQNDAANLLKPALARGELRTIAATTWSEYKKYFEKDAALARRFQVVKVEEPSEEVAASMLRAMVPLMEQHFNVRVFDEAITEAVRLSARYISGRQLPDKAVSVLDTACAKVALGQNATPAAIEDRNKRLERLDHEIRALQRESAHSAQHADKLSQLQEAYHIVMQELEQLQRRYAQEKELTEEIKLYRSELEQLLPSVKKIEHKHATKLNLEGNEQISDLKQKLQTATQQLKALQEQTPMIPLQVDGMVIADIISGWTGIPLGKMVQDEIRSVLGLQSALQARVIGQDHALNAVAQRIRTARANLEDPNKPKGVFLFVGPSGVGKTETALALADALYGGERKLITINMSEYQEAHSVSGLKGSPPGYVGYGEGGVLTEAVRRNPYSVVLLDEVEKAHPDVLELFFQVFDKGVMDDAEGREIDFRNTVIILTSNVGSAQIMNACLNKQQDDLPTTDALSEMLRPSLFKQFKPAFLGRMKVIPYYPISDEILESIIRLKLDRIAARIQKNHHATFHYDNKLVEAIWSRCTEVDSGARNVDHILNGTLLPEIAEHVLARMAEGVGIEKIKASALKNGDFKLTIQ